MAKPRWMTIEPSVPTQACHAWMINIWHLYQARPAHLGAQVNQLSSQKSSQVLIKPRFWLGCSRIYSNRHIHTLTFDSREVNAGMLVNPNTVANDPKGAFLKCTWTRDQLREKDKIIISSPLFWLNDCTFRPFLYPNPFDGDGWHDISGWYMPSLDKGNSNIFGLNQQIYISSNKCASEELLHS